jgi:hypothetical protein
MESNNRIHTYNILKKEEMPFMYTPGARANPPKIQNFLPELNYLHRLLRATLALRIGDDTTCPQYERNLIKYYMEKKQFPIFDYILVEILNISKTALRSYAYAPQIMMMIEKVTDIEFVKDFEITDIKPQAPTTSTYSPDVSSSSAAPGTTRSGTAPPPPTSSSIGGILRVLKRMFRMCQDTRGCQDVLLNNRRHQNDNLGLNEFDEFPLPEPPLDEDPFAFLSPTELASMGAAPGDDDDDEYEEGDDDDE